MCIFAPVLLAISTSHPIFVLGFLLFIGICLALDLGVLKGSKLDRPSLKESGIRTAVWVSLGVLFSLVIWFFHADMHSLSTRADFESYRAIYKGTYKISSNLVATREAFSWEAFMQYLSGYFVEYSLSLDNLFVMMLIFKSFKVNYHYEKKILLWGVLGAVFMRFLFIFLGGALIARFNWILYIFGAFLVYSGFKLLLPKKEEDTIDTENHPVVRTASKIFRVTKAPSQGKFFQKIDGKWYVTGLFVVLLVIEFSDVIFAVDSVPAIFGITRDPYLVFFSNIFAILGLRSLFFLLGHSIGKFHSLEYGLSIILIYIGGKMIFEKWFTTIGFTHLHNLLVLFGILFGAFIFAFLVPAKSKGK